MSASTGRALYRPTFDLADFFQNEVWPFKESREWAPRTNVMERSDEYVIAAELPGVSQNEIEVRVENDTLKISGHREMEKQTEGEQYLVRERSYGSFSRSFVIPKNVDASKISAEAKDGVLEVRLPKAAEATARKIKIGK